MKFLILAINQLVNTLAVTVTYLQVWYVTVTNAINISIVHMLAYHIYSNRNRTLISNRTQIVAAHGAL